MILRRPVALLVVLGATTLTPCRAQVGAWRDRDYGIGVVSYVAMDRYAARDVVRASPSRSSDTVAVLVRDSLCFRAAQPCAFSYQRMIEFGYEIPGWAVLAFSRDSAWVHVTLAPSDPAGPKGWVELRPDSVRALLWSQILPTKSLFFLHAGDIAFYSAPTRTARIRRRLVPPSAAESPNHIMRPLQASGRWLRVELEYPSSLCEWTPPRAQRDTVWIEYLTPRRRPRVFYFTRGC
jgi:hypothetical protein